MEGRGVTNYEAGTPSYGFTTATTEFDDELISRGVVTFEQAMIAKGASPSEARRLTELKAMDKGDFRFGLNEDCVHESSNIRQLGDGHDIESHVSGEIDDDDDDDDEFIRKYRQNRINELKTGTNQEYGDVLPISRPDWNREVNEASKDGLWVIVNLTLCSTSHSVTHDEICYEVEALIKQLANKFVNVKFVSIPSTSAIENWPVENLPSIFCYRYGKMQHQLIGIETLGGAGVNIGRLEWRLALLGVLETDLEDDPRPSRTENMVFNGAGGQFRGGMSRHATSRQYDIDDFDDVD
jgi:hypothetical protein